MTAAISGGKAQFFMDVVRKHRTSCHLSEQFAGGKEEVEVIVVVEIRNLLISGRSRHVTGTFDVKNLKYQNFQRLDKRSPVTENIHKSIPLLTG
jgi:hypothetical protein